MGAAPIDRYRQKCAFFTRKFGYLGPKVNFLFSDRNFCWWNKWPLYPGLQLSHRNHPQKNFRFRARGHFLGLTPIFGRFWPFPNIRKHLYDSKVRNKWCPGRMFAFWKELNVNFKHAQFQIIFTRWITQEKIMKIAFILPFFKINWKILSWIK